MRYWLPSLTSLSVTGSNRGSGPHSWLQLLVARVSNNDFVFCNSGLWHYLWSLRNQNKVWQPLFQPLEAEATSRRFKEAVLLFFPFGSQTFKKTLVRPLADHKDNRRETSMTTHNKEYALCKKQFGKVTNGWLQHSGSKILQPLRSELDFHKYYNITFITSSFEQKKL